MSIIHLPEVCRRVGLARSTVWARISQGTFPEPVKLGPKRVGWVEAEIDAWIQARIDERDRLVEFVNGGEVS